MFQYWRLYKILSHKNSNQTHLYLQFWMSDSALAWTKLLHFWSSAVMNHLSGLWNTFSWRVLSGSWNSFHNLTFTHKSFVKSYKKLKVKWKWMNLFPDVIWWFLIKFAALRMILTFGRFHTRTWWWWSWWWSWCYNDDDSWRWVLVRHEGQCAPECTVVYSGV